MGEIIDYKRLHQELKTVYSDPSEDRLKVKGVSLGFYSFSSNSSLTTEDEDEDPLFAPGLIRKYNDNFNYPVFIPENEGARKKAIVLLHGLNERNWDKYLTWSHSLARLTGKTVIMFPIAYHMSRAPEQWKDPRRMLPYVQKRKISFPDIKMLSVANVAISDRLTRKPERLFLSGHQAASDLIALIDSIMSGEHPLFDKGATVDFFTYSIGTFLTQILMLGNPGQRFDNSKFFFFCGGSVFEDMNGISKYILDTEASGKLRDYYQNDFEKEIKENKSWQHIYDGSGLGNAFRSMMSFPYLKQAHNGLFSGYKDRLMAAVLKHDRVVIPDAVRKVLKNNIVTEFDFEYKYIHENPFPLASSPAVAEKVNIAFNKVINKAVAFLV